MGVEENTSLDFSKMSSAQLEASLNDEPFDQDDATTEGEPQANEDTGAAAEGQSPSPETEGQQEGDQTANEDEAQRKLVDLRALQEERELRKAERDRAAALEAELARYRQQEAAALAAQHDQQIQAQYEQILIEQGEDAAAGYIRAVTQQREQALSQQFQQQQALNTLVMSEDLFREVHTDYDDRFNRMREVVGDDAMAVLVDRALKENPRSPAKWLYEQSKANFPTEADRQEAIQAEVAKQLAALQGKNKPPAVRGHSTIGHISSATQNPGATKPIRKMSDAELERSLYE